MGSGTFGKGPRAVGPQIQKKKKTIMMIAPLRTLIFDDNERPWSNMSLKIRSTRSVFVKFPALAIDPVKRSSAKGLAAKPADVPPYRAILHFLKYS